MQSSDLWIRCRDSEPKSPRSCLPASGLARSCLTSRSWSGRHDPSLLPERSWLCRCPSCVSFADISAHCDAKSVQGMSERPPARKRSEPLASKEDALIECSELHSMFQPCPWLCSPSKCTRCILILPWGCLCRVTDRVLQDGLNLWVAL